MGYRLLKGKIVSSNIHRKLFTRSDDTWHEKLHECIIFWQQNNKYPTSNSKDAREKKLGEWLSRQKGYYTRDISSPKRLSAERIQAINDAFPDFPWTQEVIWLKQFERCKNFWQQNNRLPSEYSKDLDEKCLGYWLVYHRSARKEGRLSLERIQAIDDAFPSFRWTNDSVWHEKLLACKHFRFANKKYPTTDSEDPEEAMLSRWLTQQKVFRKNGRLTKERLDAINATFPDFQWTKDDIWFDNLHACVNFYQQHKKYPNQCSIYTLEKRLGLWMATQKSLHKRGKLLPQRIQDFNQAFPNFL